MAVNAIGREIPEYIPDIGKLEPFEGEWVKIANRIVEKKCPPPIRAYKPVKDKVVPSIKDVVRKIGLEDGMVVSFHHHLRDGDALLPKVLDELAEMGLKNLHLAPSSLTNSHQSVVKHIRSGVVSRISTSGIRGELGLEISRGLLDIPVMIRSHGGRARAIETGDPVIDVTFIAAPCADALGNANGVHGPSACGSLGYPMTDMQYARHVVVVTDNLVEYPAKPISIPQYHVDHVVLIDKLGDPKKIATGSTRLTKNPLDLRIAQLAAKVIQHSGYFVPGFSFQTGAGGASLAVAAFVREIMLEKGLKGSFGLGGITGYMVKMLEEGLFHTMFDTQSFDMAVCDSLRTNPNHIEVSSGFYADPFNKGCLTNNLDIVVLGALEVDVDYNVNAITGSTGVITGASGGHCDTAAGARLTVVVAPSMRTRIPIIRDRVNAVVTPGESVDVVVTERGVCINPRRKDLIENLKGKGLVIKDIHELHDEVRKLTGAPEPAEVSGKIVGLVEYRDGTIIDTIKAIKH
jgi:citrate lyase subunit alpha / citrate CoA-transferase